MQREHLFTLRDLFSNPVLQGAVGGKISDRCIAFDFNQPTGDGALGCIEIKQG
jgi:hypothetical protein